MESTYEVPFEVPEISTIGYKGSDYAVAERVHTGMGIDAEGRLYLLALTRLKEMEENKVGHTFMIISRSTGKSRSEKVKFEVDATGTDLYQILVFDNSGKIVASKKMNIYANNLRIYKDRLFLIDTHVNMKIYEYKIRVE